MYSEMEFTVILDVDTELIARLALQTDGTRNLICANR